MTANRHIQKAFERREVKFLIVGVINTVVGYGSYVLFVFLGVNYMLASVFSSVIGIINSYIWNKLFTFKSRNKGVREFVRFLSVYMLSFSIGLLVLYLLVDVYKMNKYIAGFVNLGFVVLISWFGHKHFSFKKEEYNG